MSFHHFIYFYLWIAPHVLLAAVAIVMFRRGLHKSFPIFFTYVLYEFLQFFFLFAMHSLDAPISTYVKSDMFARAVSIALRFGILQEMFEAPVAHSAPLRRTVARTLNWSAGALAMLALVFIGFLYYSILSHRIFQGYVIVEALNTAQCGLLVLVFLWHRYLGLRMSPALFGIAVGMGLATGLGPLMQALKDSLAPQDSGIVDIVEMATYHVAVLVWLYYAQVREKITSNSTAALPDMREQAAEMGRIAHL